MKLSNGVKVLLILVFLAASVTGFMLKLPATFRHHDKQAHAGFYFLAAAFLNILFATRNLLWHAFIFVVLYLFGMCIELAQEFSNKLLHRKIHGRYDVEDVEANLKGLVLFSMVWASVYCHCVCIQKIEYCKKLSTLNEHKQRSN